MRESGGENIKGEIGEREREKEKETETEREEK